MNYDYTKNVFEKDYTKRSIIISIIVPEVSGLTEIIEEFKTLFPEYDCKSETRLNEAGMERTMEARHREFQMVYPGFQKTFQSNIYTLARLAQVKLERKLKGISFDELYRQEISTYRFFKMYSYISTLCRLDDWKNDPFSLPSYLYRKTIRDRKEVDDFFWMKKHLYGKFKDDFNLWDRELKDLQSGRKHIVEVLNEIDEIEGNKWRDLIGQSVASYLRRE